MGFKLTLMKLYLLLFPLLLGCSMFAQKSLFVRVYDLSGKKINKGRVFAATDTTLALNGKFYPISISVGNIGAIRTRHTVGHNVAIGAVTGTVVGLAIGLADPGSSDPNSYDVISKGDAVAVGAVLGAAAGALIGALSASFKDTKHFIINGDPAKWKAFQLLVASYNEEKKEIQKEKDNEIYTN
jgi:hypothetical protein